MSSAALAEPAAKRGFLEGSGVLRTLGRLALFLLALVVLEIGLSAVLFAGTALTVGGLWGGSFDDGVALIQDPDFDIWFQIVSTPLLLVAVVLLIWVFRRYLDRRSLRSLGLQTPRQGWTFSASVGLAAGGLAVAGMVLVLVQAGGYRYTGLSDSLSTWLLVPVLLLAAFHEEIIVRGYLMKNLLESSGPFWALFLSSLVFWLFHSLNPAAWSSSLVAVNLFGAGILLGLAFLASGDLWFPTFVHYAWNLMQGVILELPISGVETDGVVDLERTGALPTWLTGGEFGFEGSILATLSEVILALWFFLWWRRDRRKSLSPAL